MPSSTDRKDAITGDDDKSLAIGSTSPVSPLAITAEARPVPAVQLPSLGFTNDPASFDGVTAEYVATTTRVPDVARAFSARKEWLVRERIYAVQAYAVASKRTGRILTYNVQTKAWLDRIDGLLSLHEYDFEISPKLRDEAAIDTYLKLMFDDERFHFPQEIQNRAKALYEAYEACNWTSAIELNENDSEGFDIDDISAARLNKAIPSAVPYGNVTIKQPPHNDPVWGLNGIMHGVLPRFGKIKTVALDRRFEKRSANVFGHNGLQPGDWFPNQMVTLFHGGHGARQGGICGKNGVGAYSVVVSGQYKDVDEDHGDTVIYSGPNSQTNTDPNNIPQGSAQILAYSLPSATRNDPGRPVRVFRSATSHAISPAVGIRYDGLYYIEKRLPEQKNAKGGLYCRFVLRRVPGQESLRSIWARSPTARQKRDYARIWNVTF